MGKVKALEQPPTEFRQGLIKVLKRICCEAEHAAFAVAYSFLDAPAELLCEAQTYSSAELINFEPFAREFSPAKLDLIRGYMRRIIPLDIDRWAEFKMASQELLAVLKNPPNLAR